MTERDLQISTKDFNRYFGGGDSRKTQINRGQRLLQNGGQNWGGGGCETQISQAWLWKRNRG